MIEFIKPLRNSIAALTYGSGLTLMESNGHSRIIEKRDGLLSNSVYSVFQDSGNKIWIGTLNGVSVYDGRKIVRTYSYVNGLIGSKVLCIFRDPQMRLWILTDKYLHLVEKNNLRAIQSQPVLFDNKNSINRAEYDTLTGNLYLGLTDALVIVQVNKIIPDTIVHSPKLYSVIMGDSSLNLDRQHYTASAGFPKLVFQFANQQSPFGHRSDIYYKLTGYNDEWQLLDNSGELTYEKLPQGNYNLWAKTINPDGYSSPETLLAKFDILPPFWRRGWFLSLSLLLLLSVVFYLGNKYSRIQYEKRIRHLQEVYQIQMERERIARELHDNVGSQLTYLINKIEDEHSLLADKDEAEKLGRFARDTMRELRETIWALDKKEVLPEELEVKVRQLLQLYKDDHRIIELSWEYDNAAQIKLKSLEALNIYRVIQEALNNGVKYSGASLIRISAHFFRAGMSISIEDNGKGFDAAQIENGYGFPNMQKRVQEMNGALVIEGRPGKGTQVSFRIG
jgi:signal transduction histidine kinase